MRIKILLMLLLSVFLLQNCSSKVKIASVATSNQKQDYDGNIISEKKHVVTMSHYKAIPLAKGKTIFLMLLENGSESPVKISKDNLSVVFEGASEGWTYKKIKILSYDEFSKDLERDYYNEETRLISDIIRRVDTTARSIENKENDGQKRNTASMFEIRLYNTVYTIENLHKHMKQLKGLLPDLVLKSMTVLPGESISVIVVCDTKDLPKELTGNFQVDLSIDGEDHEFTFKRSI